MGHFHRSILLPVSIQEAFEWHERYGAFQRLMPPWEKVQCVACSGAITNGSRVELAIYPGPLPVPWLLEHQNYDPPNRFEDHQISGPFSYWSHVHRFEAQGQQTLLVDEIQYRLPFQWLTRYLEPILIDKKLARLFDYRHQTTYEDLCLLAERKRKGVMPMKILVSGSSGLVGRALTAFLSTQGHDVCRLVRCLSGKPDEILWAPSEHEVNLEAISGFDAVIHLAGENIAEGRWTPKKKALIRNSRVEGTNTLVEALCKTGRPPEVFISASAIGFYGNSGDSFVDEDSPHGEGFLSEVCQAWESVTEPLSLKGIRVVNLRIGMVLSPLGGALKMMLPIFQLGGGGRLGSGKQYMSWISLDDLVAIIDFALHNPSLSGPVNAVSPEPVTNAQFTTILGRVLFRPTIAPIPSLAVKALFGEMADALLLSSTCVIPKKLINRDFTFHHANLGDALKFLLGRDNKKCA